jgi:hypothetical protein
MHEKLEEGKVERAVVKVSTRPVQRKVTVVVVDFKCVAVPPH